MFFPREINPEFMTTIRNLLDSNEPDAAKIQRLWETLTLLQSILLGRHLAARLGNRVFAGPFRDMQILPENTNASAPPMILGTYEWELHEEIEKVIAKNYKQIVNIGSSFGYYAIGLARRCPQTTVYAYDIDPKARAACKKMAELNNVQNRVVIGERFNGEDFERFAGPETLIFMDIEGDEETLLDPQRFPALQKMDVIVEMHDCVKQGLSVTMPLRFANTHEIKTLLNRPFNFPLEKILGPDYRPSHFDNLIATWESRVGPTPFGIFIANRPAPALSSCPAE